MDLFHWWPQLLGPMLKVVTLEFFCTTWRYIEANASTKVKNSQLWYLSPISIPCMASRASDLFVVSSECPSQACARTSVTNLSITSMGRDLDPGPVKALIAWGLLHCLPQIWNLISEAFSAHLGWCPCRALGDHVSFPRPIGVVVWRAPCEPALHLPAAQQTLGYRTESNFWHASEIWGWTDSSPYDLRFAFHTPNKKSFPLQKSDGFYMFLPSHPPPQWPGAKSSAASSSCCMGRLHISS